MQVHLKWTAVRSLVSSKVLRYYKKWTNLALPDYSHIDGNWILANEEIIKK